MGLFFATRVRARLLLVAAASATCALAAPMAPWMTVPTKSVPAEMPYAYELPCWREHPPEPERARPVIAVVPSASQIKVAAGERIPLDFSIVNQGGSAVRVLRSLDASDVGWRYPKINIEVRDAAGELVPVPMMGRCGLVNPLTADAFVALAPGQRLSLLGEGTFGHYALDAGIAEAGRYTLTLRYDLTFESRDKSSPSPDLAAAIAALPQGIYSSEPVVVDVTPGR
jgi:hypothetical protein